MIGSSSKDTIKFFVGYKLRFTIVASYFFEEGLIIWNGKEVVKALYIEAIYRAKSNKATKLQDRFRKEMTF